MTKDIKIKNVYVHSFGPIILYELSDECKKIYNNKYLIHRFDILIDGNNIKDFEKVNNPTIIHELIHSHNCNTNSPKNTDNIHYNIQMA